MCVCMAVLFCFVLCVYIVYNFINQRKSDVASEGGRYCDKTTVIVYNDKDPIIACARQTVNDTQNFIKQYCLQYGAVNGTNFSAAMQETLKVVKENEKTCIIFLTDGDDTCLVGSASDAIACTRKITQNKDMVRMFMVRVGNAGRPRQTLDKMAQAANTNLQEAPDAPKLNDFFIHIVAKETVKFSLVQKK